MLPFAVVDFLDGGGVAIVPCKWFTGPEEDYCRWPPGRINITKAVKDQLVPNTDWPEFRVRILGKAANYAHAREKLLKSEVNSDLQSESDSGMGKGKRKRWQTLAPSPQDESGTAMQDQPSPSSSSTPQSVNIRPFVRPPLLSTPSAVPTTQHVLRRVQVDNSAFRDGMFSRILTLLEEIKDTQRVHGRMIQTLLSRGDAPAVSVLPEGTVFPLKTVSDVQEMEQKLADPTFHKEVVAVVADIGGATVDEAMRRMMGFLMDNALAREYNFVGRHGKLEFRKLRLFEVVYGSLKKNSLTKEITRKDAEKAASKWFIGARDRGGNRAMRACGRGQTRSGDRQERQGGERGGMQQRALAVAVRTPPQRHVPPGSLEQMGQLLSLDCTQIPPPSPPQ